MPQKNQSPTRTRELVGIFFILLAIFFLLSLLTHDPADYGNRVYPANEVLHNKAGKIGAVLSHTLFLVFGLPAYLLAFLTGLWGFFLLQNRPMGSLAIKLTSLGLCVTSTVTLAGLLTPDNFSSWPLACSMESFGGLTGYLMSDWFTAYFGYWGTLLLSFFVMFSSAVLATDWVVYEWLIKLGRFLRSASGGVIYYGGLVLEKIRRARAKQQMVKQALAPAGPMSALPPVLDEAVLTPVPMTETIEEEITDDAEELTEPPVKTEKPDRPQKTVASTKLPADFKLPSVDLLDQPEIQALTNDDKDIKERIDTIEKTLKNFGIEARVVDVECGPIVTKYEIELGPGISVHRVAGMSDDLAITLKSANVRIVAPIPGKATVGIEVPNAIKGIVRLKELITLPLEEKQKLLLPLFLGKDVAGKPVAKDLRDMPHLLIAGTTGAGKSVCVASVILSLLMTRTPEELKLLLIDPKMVELSVFKDIPHLISPVVTDMRRAPSVLQWLVRTMEERYELFLHVGVKKIESYNQLSASKIKEKLAEDGEEPVDIPTRLPYIVVLIDELADMMMSASDEVESAITRLAQKSRAVGIHLVMATQRPSVDVITGLIKSNMPTRISFKVASKVDSRTILDRNGAEKLLGKGDMLMLSPPATDLLRGLCTFISDAEIKNVVNFLKEQGEPVFDDELLSLEQTSDFEDLGQDELFDQAAQIVLETQRGSVSLLQRRLEIGYTRAARLVDMMARVGIVGEYKGSKAREVLMTLEEWESRKATPR